MARQAAAAVRARNGSRAASSRSTPGGSRRTLPATAGSSTSCPEARGQQRSCGWRGPTIWRPRPGGNGSSAAASPTTALPWPRPLSGRCRASATLRCWPRRASHGALLLPLPAGEGLSRVRCRLCRRPRRGDPAGRAGDGGRVHRRADPGRVGGGGGPSRGLRGPGGGDLPAPRRALRRRRGDDGLRPHGAMVRDRVERRPARHRDLRQGDERWLPARRRGAREREGRGGGRGRGRLRPRLHVLPSPGHGRGLPGRARHPGAGGPRGPRRAAGRRCPVADGRAPPAPPRGRRARARPHARRGAGRRPRDAPPFHVRPAPGGRARRRVLRRGLRVRPEWRRRPLRRRRR